VAKYSAAEGTKAKLIDAAGELAAKVGLDNVSTRAVAERSGENIGSIHYHFGGKDGLFEAVVREAISGCVDKAHNEMLKHLDESQTTPEGLSRLIRIIVQGEINDLFRADCPQWHAQVIYQLLQREDALFELFQREVMNPGLEAMRTFFRRIDPDMKEDEILLRMTILKMPIFAHANYMSVLQRVLNTKSYSEEYLQKMEDLLVRQTQLLLGLPEDLNKEERVRC
jgi:AcrR family transcriptional regulator